jgi:hypothetical protein
MWFVCLDEDAECDVYCPARGTNAGGSSVRICEGLRRGVASVAGAGTEAQVSAVDEGSDCLCGASDVEAFEGDDLALCCDTGASAVGMLSFTTASTAAFVTPFVAGGASLDSSCAATLSIPSSFASLLANSFFAGASTAGSTADLVCGFDARGLLRGRGMATRLGAACMRLGLCDC